MRKVEPITLTERSELEKLSRGRSIPARLVQRAKIILKAASGMRNKEIVRELKISKPTVQLWRERFLALRLSGLEKDAPRPGRIPEISEQKVKEIVEATLHTTPANATHWNTRTMAEAQSVSKDTVQRIWKLHNLKPHLTKTFKISNDKHFVEKLVDVVGLYINPPDKSLVLSFDEKSQIQALNRTQPSLPLKKGKRATVTHDYKRNGTTTLFASLSVLDGKVIGECMPRHRHQEVVRFLKKIDNETPPELDLHVIMSEWIPSGDNYATHKHPAVKRWLYRHPRFHIHFTPTSSSWLNLVERWFMDLTEKKIRRGSFHNVPMPVNAIYDYIHSNNQNPKLFVWTASVQRIMAKIAKSKQVLETLH